MREPDDQTRRTAERPDEKTAASCCDCGRTVWVDRRMPWPDKRSVRCTSCSAWRAERESWVMD